MISEPTIRDLLQYLDRCCPCLYVKRLSSPKPWDGESGRPDGCCLACWASKTPDVRDLFDFAPAFGPHPPDHGPDCYWPGHAAVKNLTAMLKPE